MSSDEFVTTYYQTDPKNPALERFDEIELTDFLSNHCDIYLEQLKPIPSSVSVGNSKKNNPRAEFEANDTNWLSEYFEDISFASFDSLPTKYTNCVLTVNNPILKRMVCYGDDEAVYCFELQL
ncbi:predicted protein [Naegleria gruberi]|uniref:Predicted protein n=1 Tax=Naegleria gruberi TaxID=5762 RepID=D2VTI0_NAEGR|nr:uncharacterized protein NAEGRDRAFT_72309 [Naegleria gruberi]EFC39862.1 predicted protein [Naegleria gruberi]|eukprot:XP_002672606.1 predicted protein [Naegleria gruberi strain NEG-M]